MTERNDDLAPALADLPVPEHGPRFWARLDERLAEQAADRPPAGMDRHLPASRHGHDDGDGDAGGAVIPLASARRRRPGRARWLAVAAAAVVAIAASVTVLQGDDAAEVVTVAGEGDDAPPPDAPEPTGPADPDPESDRERSGEPTDEAGPPTGATPDPTTLSSVEPVGRGLVVAALPAPGGSATVLVRDLLPGDATGCEGAPLEGLLALADDGTTRPVLAADGAPIVNGVDVHAAPAGDRVAVTSVCEGFLQQLLVGRVGPDGVPTGLEVVAGYPSAGAPRLEGAPVLEQVPSLAWTPDGSRLLVSGATLGGEGAGAERSLWSYEPGSGTWTERTDAPAGAIAAVERADGTLVAVTEDALVVGDDVHPRAGAIGLTLGPDGQTVAAYGSEGLLVLDGITEEPRQVATGFVSDARFLPGGRALIANPRADGGASPGIVSVLLDGQGSAVGDPVELGRSDWGWFRPLPDGTGLLVTVPAAGGDEAFRRPVVERWVFSS